MHTYRCSRTLHAGEDRVFEYLADVHNLPEYFDRMTAAHPAGGDQVDVTAEVHGETERGKAWFRVDRTARRIQWGSQTSPYSGMLDITADQDRTTVDIELHTEHTDHTADGEIQQALDRTLDHIQDRVEADSARKGGAAR